MQDRLGARAFRRFLGFFPALAAGMLLSALIASRGHLSSYLSFTRDVADWQFWYYGVNSGDKCYSLIQLIQGLSARTWIHWGVYLAVMLYCLYRLCRRRENDRIILFVFLYTSIVAGQIVYIIGSGGDNFMEGVYVFTLLCIAGLAIKGVCALAVRLRKGALLHTASAALAGVYILFMAVDTAVEWRDCQAFRAVQRETWAWVEQLDGSFRGVPAKKALAFKEMYSVVGDESLFSTYATALDDMRGTFQPTGYDYVIHVLGDERFRQYVEDFCQNQYSYVQTTNFRKWYWENWTARASWELYRELYASYMPIGDYSLWTLWEWQGENANVLDAEVTPELLQLDEHRVQITVRSAEQRPCCVDVVLSWDNDYVMNLYRLQTYRSAVYVQDDSFGRTEDNEPRGFFRRPHESENHIMVYMQDGVGSVILEGYPMECTQLTVHSTEVGEVTAAPPVPPQIIPEEEE